MKLVFILFNILLLLLFDTVTVIVLFFLELLNELIWLGFEVIFDVWIIFFFLNFFISSNKLLNWLMTILFFIFVPCFDLDNDFGLLFDIEFIILL